MDRFRHIHALIPTRPTLPVQRFEQILPPHHTHTPNPPQNTRRYASFVETLDTLSRDNLEFVKDRAVKSMYELLSAKPEQEARLLAALVNKLGDPDRKLASKVGGGGGVLCWARRG